MLIDQTYVHSTQFHNTQKLVIPSSSLIPSLSLSLIFLSKNIFNFNFHTNVGKKKCLQKVFRLWNNFYQQKLYQKGIFTDKNYLLLEKSLIREILVLKIICYWKKMFFFRINLFRIIFTTRKTLIEGKFLLLKLFTTREKSQQGNFTTKKN